MHLMGYLQSLATDYSPRVHANGFIQIDITPAVRLHIWGDARIPRQKNPTPIHDHAFGFTSRVVVGVLDQRTYRLRPWLREADVASHEAVYQPHVARIRRGEDTALMAAGEPVVATLDTSICIDPDVDRVDGIGVYEMQPDEFHETVPLCASVSVIVKRGKTLSQGGASPTVLVPLGVEPSNEFDRHAALRFGELWQIVTDVVSANPEAVATGIAWALRRAEIEKAAEIDLRLSAMSQKLEATLATIRRFDVLERALTH